MNCGCGVSATSEGATLDCPAEKGLDPGSERPPSGWGAFDWNEHTTAGTFLNNLCRHMREPRAKIGGARATSKAPGTLWVPIAFFALPHQFWRVNVTMLIPGFRVSWQTPLGFRRRQVKGFLPIAPQRNPCTRGCGNIIPQAF